MIERCGDWIGAFVDYPGFVAEDGAAYRPVAVVWLEAESGLIIDTTLVKPLDALPRAAGLFLLATREPKVGPPRVPRRVRVEDPALGAALQGAVEDVEVIVEPTPEINDVLASMRDFMRREDADETYLDGGVTAADLTAFFVATAAFYRAEPWDAIPPDRALGVRCPALGIEDGIGFVVGQMRQEFGMSLYFTRDDAEAMVRTAMEERAEIRRHIMLSFDGTVSPRLRREVEEHGWRLAAPDAYPSARFVESDLISRALTPDELAGLSAILFAIASLTSEKRQDVMHAFRGEFGIVHACAVLVCGERIAVEITAPGMHEVVNDDPLAWESFEDETDDVLEVAITAYYMRLLEVLRLEDGSPEAELVGLLVDTAADFYAVPLLQLSPIQLRQMLKELPRHGVRRDERELTFDLLVRAFEHADTESVKELSPAARERFVAALAKAKKKPAATKKKPAATKKKKPAATKKPKKPAAKKKPKKKLS